MDLNEMTLLDIEDPPAVASAPVMGEYAPALVRTPSTRPALKPLEIVQPEGVSFDLNGYQLSWQNWSMRLGFNYREGLVLHRVAYTDAGSDGAERTRSIAHRLSFALAGAPRRERPDRRMHVRPRARRVHVRA